MKGVYNRNISLDFDAEMSGDECMDTFEDMIYLAKNEDRLTTGVFESAHVLETDPDIVLLCVLPETKSNDISILIQHKLIEAYCWENDIEVMKMDDVQLSKTVKLPRSKSTDVVEMGCVLVTSQTFVDSEQDDDDLGDHEIFG